MAGYSTVYTLSSSLSTEWIEMKLDPPGIPHHFSASIISGSKLIILMCIHMVGFFHSVSFSFIICITVRVERRH